MRARWFLAVPVSLMFVAQPAARGYGPTGQATHAAAPDIVLTATGCHRTEYTLPPTHSPELTLRNTASRALVFTLPDLRDWMAVPPGATVTMAVQPYIWGQFDFLCVDEQEHSAAMGDATQARRQDPFLCTLDAWVLKPKALSTGTLTIEYHTRTWMPAPAG